MVAAFYGKVRTDDAYNKVREKFGDTTSIEAQLRALKIWAYMLNLGRTVMGI
jgi:hypothetical protein